MKQLDDLDPQMSFTRSLRLSDDIMQAFLDASGDDNELHTSHEFAREHGFDSRVGYGNIVGFLVSAVVGVEMRSFKPMLLSESITFHRPMYVGDALTLTAVVSSKSAATGTGEFKFIVDNQQGARVASGKFLVKFL